MTARVAGALLLGAFSLPLLGLLVDALLGPGTGSLVHTASTVLPGYARTTMLLVTGATLLALGIGTVTAALVVFCQFPGRRLLEVALALPLLLPPYLVAIVYREAANDLSVFGLVETLPGAVIIFGLTLFPYPYLLLKLSLQAQAARYTEIGKTLGLSRPTVVRRIILPLVLPAAALGAILVALEVLSDFGTASTLGVATLSILIHRSWLDLFDQELAARLGLISLLLPMICIAIVAVALRGRDYSNPSNRGTVSPSVRLGTGAGAAAAVVCGLPIVLASLLPLLLMLYWAVPALARMSLESLSSDLTATVSLALAGAGCSLLVAMLFSLLGRARKGARWSWAVAVLSSINYAMPAIALSISLLAVSVSLPWAPVREFLSNSVLLIVLAIVLRYAVFAVFSIDAGLRGIANRVDDVVEMVHGRGWLRRGWVLAVNIRSYVVLAALLVFISSAKDLSLPLVLQPFGYGSLSLQIYNHAIVDLHGQAAVYGLCLAAVCLYPAVALGRWFRAT